MTHFYTKASISSNEAVTLLKHRGLIIPDEAKAQQYIENIGYFRLSAYFYPLLLSPKNLHRYKEGTSFIQVLDMYRFDRKLRIIILNEIEKIEVALRSIIINEGCTYYNSSFWLTTSSCFRSKYHFDNSMDIVDNEIGKSKEDFILHFRKTYADTYPPAWMVAEILSLGAICSLYKNIKSDKLKKIIAKRFGLNIAVFESWIMALAGIRNICCHHGRLWNRALKIKPIFPKKTVNEFIAADVQIQRIYFRLCMIKYLLGFVSPNNTFTQKLLDLLTQYNTIDTKAMGFQENWEEQPIWS